MDAASHYSFLYFSQSKSDSYSIEALDNFVIDAYNVGITIEQVATFQCDGDLALIGSSVFRARLKHHGLIPRSSPAYTQAMNGLAERTIGTLKNMARTCMEAANLPKKFWPAAMLHAIYLRNRCPSSALHGDTPYFRLFGKQADIANLRVFGVDAFVMDLSPTRKSTDPKAKKGTFVGYSATSPAC
jgi:hypothetical protein